MPGSNTERNLTELSTWEQFHDPPKLEPDYSLFWAGSIKVDEGSLMSSAQVLENTNNILWVDLSTDVVQDPEDEGKLSEDGK